MKFSLFALSCYSCLVAVNAVDIASLSQSGQAMELMQETTVEKLRADCLKRNPNSMEACTNVPGAIWASDQANL